ncbi:MAG: radical SAM protein [Deltaproteobacteria bacterium]|nr:radical SAM protein [Deltaproteobacteria bacterium]MBW2053005.1 radical SAM protein [Deltaproteobacteria bacterium]MBW2324505.1 radical SAM protein [Deltaproteobacteria bacterium]
MGRCRSCHSSSNTISTTIGYCGQCIQDRFEEVWPEIKTVHQRSRLAYGLPADPPRAQDGQTCGLCFHGCSIPEGGTGFCGLRRVESSKIKGGRPHEGNLYYYHDPLPTNCVGSFVCPAGTNGGYPQFSASETPEYGFKNLAVFYNACSFNCLFCQNYHYKRQTASSINFTSGDLAEAVDEKTSCICYFGGDPAPQVLHALKAAKLARKQNPGRILRICWETNGSAQEPFLSMMAETSIESGGCIKIDLKAWKENIHFALCGVSNQKVLDNFKTLSKWVSRRPDPPFLLASTLLVPGYVDEEEVSSIASFLAGLNPDIPYSLLAFYPQFYLKDLPPTSRRHAQRCQEAAENAGLRRVHIGNIHLLRDDY